MELDKEAVRVLSADTRVEILRMLDRQRMMPAEISRSKNLAASTVVEHLQKLEHAGLVTRKETGHKWVYYELTRKGRGLLRPELPVYVILAVPIGLILLAAGFMAFYTSPAQVPGAFTPAESIPAMAGAPAKQGQETVSAGVSSQATQLLGIGLIIIGVLLAAFGLWRIMVRRGQRT